MGIFLDPTPIFQDKQSVVHWKKAYTSFSYFIVLNNFTVYDFFWYDLSEYKTMGISLLEISVYWWLDFLVHVVGPAGRRWS